MLQWVIDSAKQSAKYMSKPGLSLPISASVYLLIPFGDQIKHSFYKTAQIIEGPEFDVLERYNQCLNFSEADYVVRVTGDCPLIPDHVITKTVNVAIRNGYDYYSNVEEGCRLALDGHDCEVISRRLLKYTYENASTESDREHVTTFIRRTRREKILPKEYLISNSLGDVDLSHIKLSVDTEEDLERVRKQKARVLECHKISEEINGKPPHRYGNG
jgi:spore coat polysaccharide biosynthesis protein SpsF (cytidylyltransferase family)